MSLLRGGWGRERGGRVAIQLEEKMCLKSDFPEPRASQNSTVLPDLYRYISLTVTFCRLQTPPNYQAVFPTINEKVVKYL